MLQKQRFYYIIREVVAQLERKRGLIVPDRIILLRLFSGEALEGGEDVFIKARREFFRDPEADQGRLQHVQADVSGVSLDYQYRFSGKKPVWVVRKGRRTVEKLVGRRNGEYSILSLDDNGNTIREERFTSADAWNGVRYFRDGRFSADASPAAGGRITVWQCVTEDRFMRSYTLLPCPGVIWDDEEAQRIVTRECGLPQALAYTQSGVVCYYEESVAEQAERCAARAPAGATYVAAQLRSDPLDGAVEPPPAPEADADALFDEIFGAVSAEAAEPPAAEGSVELPPAEELLGAVFEDAGRDAADKSQEDAGSSQAAEEPQTDTTAPSPGRMLFEGDESSILLEYSGDGRQLYAGGVRDGERSGFGVGLDLSQQRVFSGVWLYGARCGIMAEQEPDGSMRVRFEDSASQNPEMPEAESCVFGADGELLFAGQTCGLQKTGFGMAKWGAPGHRYVGGWKQDLPDGNGIELDGDGRLLYEGEWREGRRNGYGTEFSDGKAVYCGDWEDGRHHGNGTLLRADGCRITGRFCGETPNGFVCEYGADGRKLYEGEWKDGERCGRGALFLPSGERIDGTFEAGSLSGAAAQYDSNGTLLYRGTFSGILRDGKGTLYDHGEIVYEGEFQQNRFHGRGKQLEHGRTVFVGAFCDGARCGVGAAFEDGKPFYFGQWRDGERHGCGVEYRDGEPVFAGRFENGRHEGRINEYTGGRLLREMLCRDGEPVYMMEYDSGGEPVYIGAVHCEKRSGMGRLLGPCCECEEQGIFGDGKLIRSVPVLVQPLEELPCPAELKDSIYETLARPQRRCVIEQPFLGGRYSGHLRDGVPEGMGTLLYPDHCFMGAFTGGEPNGEGRLYLSTGETVEGVFHAQGRQTVACETREYHVDLPD